MTADQSEPRVAAGATPADRAFARHLRQLRERANNPTFETIARNAHCAPATVHNAVSGNKVPSDKTADAILRALGGHPDEEWRDMLREARGRRDTDRSPLVNGDRNERPLAVFGRRLWWAVAAGGLVALSALVTIGVIVLIQHDSTSGTEQCDRYEVVAKDLWLREPTGERTAQQLQRGQKVTVTGQQRHGNVPVVADSGVTGFVDPAFLRPLCD